MKRLQSNELTKGMYVRVHGENLILGREESVGADGSVEQGDRVRLTRRGRSTWALSVKRHTGRWERTPFAGGMDDVVASMCAFMQHLISAW